MRGLVGVVSVLLLASACTNAGTSGSTTTLVPIGGGGASTVTTPSSSAAPTTTSTTLIGHVDPSKQLDDDQLTKLAIAVLQEHMRGYGSEDPEKAARAERLAMGRRLEQTRMANERTRTQFAANRGELELYAARGRITTDRLVVALDVFVRDNLVLTDTRSGAVVDPSPLPRQVRPAGVAVRLDVDQWKVQLVGQPDRPITCPGG